MVIAVLASRFAPSSRGLERAGKGTSSVLLYADGNKTTTTASSHSHRYHKTNNNNDNIHQNQNCPCNKSRSHHSSSIHRTIKTSNYQEYHPSNNNLTPVELPLSSSSSTTTSSLSLPLNTNEYTNHSNLQQGDDKDDDDDDDPIVLPEGIMHIPFPPIVPPVVSTTTHQRITSHHRRKPFSAMACLTSVAADLDMITDWLFLHATIQNDRRYRQEYSSSNKDAGDSSGGGSSTTSPPQLPYLIPPILIQLVLASCIVGTILWFILATDGRVIAPILRRMGIDRINMGIVLFLCVILEDIPQVVFTFVIEDYYEEDEYLSSFALMNVVASLYDTLIKLAEAYDERDDNVETGLWCKYSVETSHTDTVTAILTLERPQQRESKNKVLSDPTESKLNCIPSTNYLKFLTASLDGTIKLWNYNQNNVNFSSSQLGLNREMCCGNGNINNHPTALEDQECVATVQCERIFHGDNTGVTCLAWMTTNEKMKDISCKISDRTRCLHPFQEPTNCSILSGYVSGGIKLYDVDTGECVRDYYGPPQGTSVSSVAVIQTELLAFVAGYLDGMIRLWDVVTGQCIGLYHGHLGCVSAICSFEDGSFVTGSEDSTLRLWQTNWAIPLLGDRGTSSRKTETALEDTTSVLSTVYLPGTPLPSDEDCFYKYNTNTILEKRYSDKLFQGHTDAVVVVACMESRNDCKIFVSGSLDQTARLWSIDGVVCLRVFTGHAASVLTVSSVDEVTLLTGSADHTIKVWDALNGICLRTYEGHTDEVTGVSVTNDDSTFVSSSVDRSAKIWVLTALSGIKASKRFDDVIDFSDGLCRGLDPV